MFRIGQKVVCVDASNSPGRRWLEDAPTVGEVYTVTRYFLRLGKPCVHLAEIERSAAAKRIMGMNVGYWAFRFRPVVERKTDISIFQAMLTPSPVTVDAMNVADHAREIVG